MRTLIFIVIGFLFGTSVAAPFATLLHELGHGIVSVLLTPGGVLVNQGGDPPLVRFRIGRLEVRLRPVVGPRSAFFGYFEVDEEGVGRVRLIAVYGGGPAASLLTRAMLVAIAGSADGVAALLAWVGAAVALGQFLTTAIPMRYGRLFGAYEGWESDGLRVLRLCRRPTGEMPRSSG